MTSSSASTTVLCTSAAKSWVGNNIQITGGTFSVAGVYNISSVTAGTSFVVDRNPDTGALLAGTGGLGGAFASPGFTSSLAVPGSFIWIKSGTYLITSTTNNIKWWDHSYSIEHISAKSSHCMDRV